MPRSKRRPKKRAKPVEKDESDEERDVPDPDSEEYFYDDVDKFHKNREKILLQKSEISSGEESNEDEQIEEVLGLKINSEDEDEEYDEEDENYHEDVEDIIENEEDKSSSESDIEKGIPSEKAWGRKKKIYYDADNEKEKDIDSEEEEVIDREEEEEALAMQQRMAARLDDDDFDIADFELMDAGSLEKKESKENDKTKQEKIIKDLSKLSKEEKLKLLAKDSPELFELINDFREKLSDVMNRLHPLVQMARSGKITNAQGIEYLEMKHQLTMNYLVNISFYLLLKAHQTSVKNHPVIERLVQYRELLGKLEPLDNQLHDEMEYLLNVYKTDEENVDNEQSKLIEQEGPEEKLVASKKSISRKKVKSSKLEDTSKSGSCQVLSNTTRSKRKSSEDLDPLSYYEAVKEMKKKKKEERLRTHLLSQETMMEGEDDEDMDGKRSITYQISKNKGLTPKRKKELRNPRIKHRKKYGKAKIKHKSQVLPVIKELSRYGGESTGIRTHLTKSIKIK